MQDENDLGTWKILAQRRDNDDSYGGGAVLAVFASDGDVVFDMVVQIVRATRV